MNEVMGLEQLENLAKNPSYKMSEEQLKRLEELRNEKFSVKKHQFFPKKHDVKIKDPDNE